jgi:large subunit ribosomal protein L10
MPRPEKVKAVADIKERIEGANAVFLAEYAGLSVKDQQALRRSLRENGAEFKVVKMTLTRLAAQELEIDELDELLVGPTGLTFADEDPVSAAKALDDFAKGHEVFTIKGGLLGRDFLAPERVQELAKIESREVLLARLAGAFQAPLANMAGLLAALPRGLATAMSQLIEKLEAEAPAEPAPAVDGEAEVAEEPPLAEDDSTDEADAEADAGEAADDGDAGPAADATPTDDDAAEAAVDDDAPDDDSAEDEAAADTAPEASAAEEDQPEKEDKQEPAESAEEE